jgi:hypothetical protein
MKDKPKLILVGDEWTQGSFVDAVTSGDLCVEDSFRKFFNVTNLGFPRQSPQQSIDILENYLRGLDLKGLFPRSNITVVFILGNTFRDFDVPQTGILDAHRRSVLNVLYRLDKLSKECLPPCSKAEVPSRAHWVVVGGSTDIGKPLLEEIHDKNQDKVGIDIIGSWCKFVDEEYASAPLSNDADRILVNSKIDPTEHRSISMIMNKIKQYEQLHHKGLMSSDYIPTGMMTDVLAEHIHKNSVERFATVSYIGSRDLHDEESKKSFY